MVWEVVSVSDYAFEGPKWPTSTVTWSFAAANYRVDSRHPFSDQIGTAYQATITSAVQRWAAISGLKLVEVPDSPDVDVRIGWGDLGSGSSIGETSFSSVNGALSPDVIV